LWGRGFQKGGQRHKRVQRRRKRKAIQGGKGREPACTGVGTNTQSQKKERRLGGRGTPKGGAKGEFIKKLNLQVPMPKGKSNSFKSRLAELKESPMEKTPRDIVGGTFFF